VVNTENIYIINIDINFSDKISIIILMINIRINHYIYLLAFNTIVY